MILKSLILACAVSSFASASSCPIGDAHCVATVGPTSYCKPESKSCHGAPKVHCECKPAKQTKSIVTTPAPARRVRSAVAAPAGARASDSNDGMFLWLEWPSLRTREWSTFYEQVLGFMHSNRGNFKVSRVIARVLDPLFHEEKGNLWQVSTDSVFYQSFLSRVPAGTELFVYPYLLESSPEKWKLAMRTSTALEAVYKYVARWNELLASVRPEITIGGIVVDYEEHAGFEEHLPRIANFRARYSTPGQPQLRFGAAMGFDVPRRAASISSNIDDVYLEMYDFYVRDSDPAELVQQGKGRMLNNVDETLRVLDRDVWGPFMRAYTQLPNMHFMWSLQAKSSKDCLYPVGSKNNKRCGTKDDLGAWTAPKAAEFINAVKERYPAMRNRPHGFFEFSYMPTSWL